MAKLYPIQHLTIGEVIRPLIDNGHYADALKKASIRLDEFCTQTLDYFEPDHGLTGVRVVERLLWYRKDSSNPSKKQPPYLQRYDLSTKKGPRLQENFCKLVSSFVSVVRNHEAHNIDDLDPYYEPVEALYAINMISWIIANIDKSSIGGTYFSLLEENNPPDKPWTVKDLEAFNYDWDSIVTMIKNSEEYVEEFKKLNRLNLDLEDLLMDDFKLNEGGEDTWNALNLQLSLKYRALCDEFVDENKEYLGKKLYDTYEQDSDFRDSIIDSVKEIY